MAEADHSQSISEFCNLTGADTDRARFYLEAAGWDTNLAMSNYYEEGDDDIEEIGSFTPPATPNSKPAAPSGGARIATFANLANNEEEEEEGQAFYAGGSVRSGQQVLGPGKRKSGNQIVEDLFDAVKKNCGDLLNQSDKRPAPNSIRAFQGTGFVLGSTPEGSTSAPQQGGAAAAQNTAPPTEIRLSLWKTGFTVDDGPLRSYDEPRNKEFLDSVRQGEIPPELRRQSNGRETHMSLDDRSHEDYVPPKKMLQAFTGTGFRLGNISPQVSSAASSADCKENEEKAQSSLGLDASQPQTTIQIRLANGSRLVMNANHNHTVGDVRRFIVLSRPEYSGSEFSLMTSFPTKELSDDGATLKESGLLHSVIVQKLK